MARFALRAGVRVEPVGEAWFAYSAASGETIKLNLEAAAVLELLDSGEESAIIGSLAEVTGLPPDEIAESLRGTWGQLLDAGLVEEVNSPQSGTDPRVCDAPKAR